MVGKQNAKTAVSAFLESICLPTAVHRRDAEAPENTQRMVLQTLRTLCVLCVSAVKKSLHTKPFAKKEGLQSVRVSLQKIGGKLSNLRAVAYWFLPVAFCLCFAACGKVGAPIAPPRLTERTAELAAIQRGSKILLSWPVPGLVKNDKDSSYIARVDIYRLAERQNQQPVLDAEEYEAEAQIIGFLDRATIEAQLSSLGHLEFPDTVNLKQAPAGTRLRYAVRYVNKRGQQAAFSNTVAIEPISLIALEPTNLRSGEPKQDQVVIEWDEPKANVDGTSPAAVIGYNLYRVRASRKIAREALNSEPITETNFVDRTFQYKNEYTYIARSLSQGVNGLIESVDSKPLTITPIDTFAPDAPDPVSIASANGVISLFWPGSSETDVVRYNIFRATTETAEAKDWAKIGTVEAKFVTYRDDKVALDNRYFYRVTAVDKFDNESKPSAVVSEIAHP